jgi:hypothetical protein
MSEAYTGGYACGAIRYESSNAAALGAADWLCLAAAPTFAISSLVTTASFTNFNALGQRVGSCTTAPPAIPRPRAPTSR